MQEPEPEPQVRCYLPEIRCCRSSLPSTEAFALIRGGRRGLSHSACAAWQTTRAPGTVGPEDFVQWHRSKPTLTNESGEQPKESRFPVRKRVNEKLYTWVGPIWRVATDVIVNTTSENFSERGGVSGGIFQAAGPELERECATMEGCRTGEAKLTGAYRLPCKAVGGPFGRPFLRIFIPPVSVARYRPAAGRLTG